MKVPTFCVELPEKAKEKTLADIPEWTLAECDYSYNMHSILRFRIGDYAYSADAKKEKPMRQNLAKVYTVKKVIGQIVVNDLITASL